MASIVWTPPGSVLGLGAVLLRETPKEELTATQYFQAMEKRIHLLIKRETPERARELLREMAIRDNLTGLDDLAAAAEIMMEGSGALYQQTGAPFPVAASEIKNDLGVRLMLKEETLETFLNLLYSGMN